MTKSQELLVLDEVLPLFFNETAVQRPAKVIPLNKEYNKFFFSGNLKKANS